MDKKIADYLNKQASPQKEICLALRKILFKVFPKIKEEMKWGAIVYDHGRYYLGVVKYGVNFGFAITGLDKKELALFAGSGKTMRHIKIMKLAEIDEQKLVKLIKLVKEKASCVGC